MALPKRRSQSPNDPVANTWPPPAVLRDDRAKCGYERSNTNSAFYPFRGFVERAVASTTDFPGVWRPDFNLGGRRGALPLRQIRTGDGRGGRSPARRQGQATGSTAE
jgi:hypothetical protein